MADDGATEGTQFVLKNKRPDGSGAYNLAGFLGWGGMLAFIGSFFIKLEEYGSIDPDQIFLRQMLQLIGGAAFSVAITIALADYIVRAISFLPGREEK